MTESARDLPGHTFDVLAIITLDVRARGVASARHYAGLFASCEPNIDITRDIPIELDPGTVTITCVSARGDVADPSTRVLPDPLVWAAKAAELEQLRARLHDLAPLLAAWDRAVEDGTGGDAEHAASADLADAVRRLLAPEEPLLRIIHTRADGTRIDGTTPGDGVLSVARWHGFRLNRRKGRIEIPKSSGRTADHDQIDAAAAALRQAGFTVAVRVQN
ncbi:hypothetical protein [Planotetraspora sp. GP83]|uniref:hypothetical protein n=1 Tax=Planotetraspora sp. GP83 TaxID=3156264 RepID=UPI0035182F24